MTTVLLNLNSKEANPSPVFNLQSVLSSVGIIKDNELRIPSLQVTNYGVWKKKTTDFITVTGRNNIPEHSDKFYRENVGGSANTTVEKF